MRGPVGQERITVDYHFGSRMVLHFHVHRFLFRAAVLLLGFTFKLGVDRAYSLFCLKGHRSPIPSRLVESFRPNNTVLI